MDMIREARKIREMRRVIPTRDELIVGIGPVIAIGDHGRIYDFGDWRQAKQEASKHPSTHANLRCKRWLKPFSLQRIRTPLKRCWISHFYVLSTIPPQSASPVPCTAHNRCVLDAASGKLYNAITVSRAASRQPSSTSKASTRSARRYPACHAANGAVPSETTSAPAWSGRPTTPQRPSTAVLHRIIKP